VQCETEAASSFYAQCQPAPSKTFSTIEVIFDM